MNSFIFLLLLKCYFFYATGHETTFTHIKWDSAFHGFNGDNNNIIKRIIMGTLIILNTFSSLVICSVSVGYIYKIDLIKNNNINANFIKMLLEMSFYDSLKVLFLILLCLFKVIY